MIVHSYLTDGFFDGGKMFLKSFKKHNGEKYQIVLDTRDITKNQTDELFSLYNNISFNAQSIDYDAIGKEFSVSEERLRKVKAKVEARKTKVTKSKHMLWGKQYISVDERYGRAIESVLKNYNEPVLHIDIDTYFRNSIDYYRDLLVKNDVCLIFRLKNERVERKIFGSMVGINNTKNGRLFHKTWKKYIDANSITKRRHNFGQSSLFNIYSKFKNKMQFGDIGDQNFSKKQGNPDVTFGTANAGGKAKALKKCKKDFKNK